MLQTFITAHLKSRIPNPTKAPNVLLVGQGVDSKSFPLDQRGGLRSTQTSGDLSDAFGYGTLAASALLQLMPKALIYSYKVPNVGGVPQRIDLAGLAAALNYALDAPRIFDVVLLAFAPESALDPLLDAAILSTYGASYGSNLDLAINAIMERTAEGGGGGSGIPLDKALRDEFFSSAEMRERDAVEQLVTRYLQWQTVLTALKRLDDAGVPVVAPSGDYPLGNPGSIGDDKRDPVYTQSIYGLSARPEVITVGSAYEEYDGNANPLDSKFIIAPSSGSGPTISLRQKPDLVAPASIVGLVPNSSTIGAWLDAYDQNTVTGRVFTPKLEWGSGSRDCARGGSVIPADVRALLPANVSATVQAAETSARTAAGNAIGQPPEVSHCVLQGSTIVSAAVVAANAAGLIAGGVPNFSQSRASQDDEVVRGLLQAVASRYPTYPPERSGDNDLSVPWSEGAGMFLGAGGVNPASVPVPMDSLDLGELGCRAGTSSSVALWQGGAQASSATAQLTALLWANDLGRAMKSRNHRSGVSATPGAGSVNISLASGDYPGGFYAGRLSLTSGANTYSYPLSVTQDMCPSFRAHYAYTALQTGSVEGELAEDVTIGLYPSLPPDTGALGPAFKYLQELGVSPTDRAIRFSVTKGGSLAATPEEPYGVATIKDPGVPPGYWRYQLGTDYTVEGMQIRSGLIAADVPQTLKEGIGVKLGGGGPNVASLPGTQFPMYIPSAPGCDDGYVSNYVAGVACGSPSTFGLSQDSSTGLCYASSIKMLVYCGRASMSIPAAFTSRSVHLVEYDSNQATSELKTCVAGIDVDSGRLDLDAIARQQSRSACAPSQGATTWTYTRGAPDCLSPSEQGIDLADNVRDGLPTDVTATYRNVVGASPSGAALPIGVLTYRFSVPSPNTLTTIGVNFAYKVDNAIIAVRAIGQDPLNNATGSLLVVRDDPADPRFDMSAAPKVQTVPGAGSVHAEWTLLSAGATWGSVSFLVIPTTLIAGDFTGDAAKVQLCDIAVRVKTYAKQAWSTSGSDAFGGLPSPVQRAQMRFDHPASVCTGSPDKSACRLSGQVPASGNADERIRAWFDPQSRVFRDLGPEQEDAAFLVHAPKDTMFDLDETNKHRVRPEAFPPAGGPAYLGAVRSGSETTTFPYPQIYDPGLGATTMECLKPAVCDAWNQALTQGRILLSLPTASLINGRFFGVASSGRATLSSADGVLTWLLSDNSDSGATHSSWQTADTPPVSPFYGEVVEDKLTPPNDIRVGFIQLYRDPASQKTTLSLDVRLAAGDRQIIKITLGCVSSPGGVQCV